ncbi:hypothetical protein DPM19_04815 [Actinomadura craniellae]|uniref:Uncharacterized protein n=1 Tax=Actinomadura craniellae TaxID=2231787 RepID=A0A365HAP9_9ACTN|nr:hypothetical protein [Actinomadura craniellae]RAY16224.1 hypothetical protein DPM19_04815 [Actinomadura craniellae]
MPAFTVSQALLVPGLVLVALSSACSTGPQQATPSTQPAPATPAGLSAAGLRLPVQDYQLSPEQQRRYDQRYYVLVRECARRSGVDFPLPPQSAAYPEVLDRRYGISDKTIATRFGYRLPPDPETGFKEPNFSPSQLAVIFGTVDQQQPPSDYRNGGCAAEASRTINGVPAAAPTFEYLSRVADRVNLDDFRKSRADPRVAAAVTRWSQCMKGRGYTVHDPLRAGAEAGFAEGHVSPAETTMALADITCKEQTALFTTWHDVESRYQRRSINADASSFSQLRTRLHTILGNLV